MRRRGGDLDGGKIHEGTIGRAVGSLNPGSGDASSRVRPGEFYDGRTWD